MASITHLRLRRTPPAAPVIVPTHESGNSAPRAPARPRLICHWQVDAMGRLIARWTAQDTDECPGRVVA